MLPEALVMSGRVVPVLLLSLCLTVGSVQSQGSSQDTFIIQYLERRLAQMEVGAPCTSVWQQVPASLRGRQSTSILTALTINSLQYSITLQYYLKCAILYCKMFSFSCYNVRNIRACMNR